MNTDQRFERELPELLEALAPGPTPAYRDDIVRETARMRQRPAWTLPERWIPMTAITSRVDARSPVPLRTIVIIALLLIAMAVGIVLVAGARRAVPAPFGLAANGSIVYDASGDILAADPVTGKTTVLVSGPETDRGPVWSRDGTQFVAERTVSGAGTVGRLFVRSADGSHPVPITPDGLPNLHDYGFSPDGRTVVLLSGQDAGTQAWIAQADGSGVTRIDLPMTVLEASFLPPDGHELLLTARPADATQNGIYRYDPRTGISKAILAPRADAGIDVVQASPDGSLIAYSRTDPSVKDANSYVVHVVGVDGSGDRPLPMPTGATFQDAPAWSNDGRWLAITRGYAAHNSEMVLAVVPADGSSVGLESARGLTGCCSTQLEWAPNDVTVLVTPEGLDGAMTEQLLLDPSTGTTRPASWAATSQPAWQRRAP